jgi:hypothetical protein
MRTFPLLAGLEASPLSEESTLEVRWVHPGEVTLAMIDWFGPFVSELESREDVYFTARQFPGLSMKIRGGAFLDIKVASWSKGVLHVPDHVRGLLQAWRKWSFPLALTPEMRIESPDWVSVRKNRRIARFSFVDGQLNADASAAAGQGTTCSAEVTEVMKGGTSWWTLCFEAVGDPDTLQAAIEAAAALVFRDPVPDELTLGVVDSMSYPDWLRQSPPDHDTLI